MLAWLRKQPGGLEEMRQALDALHQVAEQLPQPRALWWAALGLLEGMAQSEDAEWQTGAKPLCNKLDFQIRDLAAGADKLQDGLLRDLLYALAKCKPVTPRIKEIRSLYQLESLFPERAEARHRDGVRHRIPRSRAVRPAFAPRGAQGRLGAVRLRRAEERRPLPRAGRRLQGQGRQLGNQHLIKLLDAIALVATKLPDPYPRQNQFMVIEMASAFLLVEQVIDHFTTPPEDLDPQIVIMGGWLLDAAKGKSTGEPPAGLRPT